MTAKSHRFLRVDEDLIAYKGLEPAQVGNGGRKGKGGGRIL